MVRLHSKSYSLTKMVYGVYVPLFCSVYGWPQNFTLHILDFLQRSVLFGLINCSCIFRSLLLQAGTEA